MSSKDIDPDALYIITRKGSEYNAAKTGKEIIRIINGANELHRKSRVEALKKIKAARANLFDLLDSNGA